MQAHFQSGPKAVCPRETPKFSVSGQIYENNLDVLMVTHRLKLSAAQILISTFFGEQSDWPPPSRNTSVAEKTLESTLTQRANKEQSSVAKRLRK